MLVRCARTSWRFGHRVDVDGPGRERGDANGRAVSERTPGVRRAWRRADIRTDDDRHDPAARSRGASSSSRREEWTTTRWGDPALVSATWEAAPASLARRHTAGDAACRCGQVAHACRGCGRGAALRAMAELKVWICSAGSYATGSAKTDDEQAHWLSIVNDFTPVDRQAGVAEVQCRSSRRRGIRLGRSRPCRPPRAGRGSARAVPVVECGVEFL